MRVLVAVVAVLSIAGPSLAQEPAGSIALGFGLSSESLDYGGECPLDDCGVLGKNLSGEGAFNITENVAALVGVGFGFANFSTSLSGIAIDASGNSATFGGGVRAYGPPGQARIFAQVLAGYLKVSGTVEAFGLRESASASGLSISPGAGVDIATGERVAVRVSGGVSIGVIEGDASTSFGVGVGLVFVVGG